jgi:hypothetical protein
VFEEERLAREKLASTRNKSDAIFARTKDKRIKEIFVQLNPNARDMIHAERIEVEVFDKATLGIMSPLLIELEELGEPLNYEEFHAAMENLIAKLTPSEKRTLLKPKKVASPDDTLTPSNMSQISRSSSGPSLYARQVRASEANRIKLAEKQAMKLTAEMEECTFQPQINQSYINRRLGLSSRGEVN